MKNLVLFFSTIITALVLMSATVLKSENQATVLPPAEVAKTQKMSYKELKGLAEEVKGEKLTLKERIALRVFGKKVSTISKHKPNKTTEGGKSQVVALILSIFVGTLGIHRFYLGYIWQGVVQLLTAGGCGIWTLIDIIRIITGDLKPKDGEYEKTL